MTEEHSIEPGLLADALRNSDSTPPVRTDAPSADVDRPLAGNDPRVVAFFGEAHPVVARFAAVLSDQGVIRGLIGPREVARLWERHLINSASVVPFLPASGTVIDVGTGAGLPGIVLAALRPDLHIVLLDPMERRVAWLVHVVGELGLESVEVVRGRAEDMQGKLVADAVTARAVAPMDRLAGWTLPLLRAGGVLLAMKGQSAYQELEDAASAIRSLGGGPGEVLEAPTIEGFAGTTIIRVVRELVIPRAPAKPKVAKGKVAKGKVAKGKVAKGSTTRDSALKGAAPTGSTGKRVAPSVTSGKGAASRGSAGKGGVASRGSAGKGGVASRGTGAMASSFGAKAAESQGGSSGAAVPRGVAGDLPSGRGSDQPR